MHNSMIEDTVHNIGKNLTWKGLSIRVFCIAHWETISFVSVVKSYTIHSEIIAYTAQLDFFHHLNVCCGHNSTRSKTQAAQKPGNRHGTDWPEMQMQRAATKCLPNCLIEIKYLQVCTLCEPDGAVCFCWLLSVQAGGGLFPRGTWRTATAKTPVTFRLTDAQIVMLGCAGCEPPQDCAKEPGVLHIRVLWRSDCW